MGVKWVKATTDLISNIEDSNNQPDTTTRSGMKTMCTTWMTNQQTNPSRDPPALDKLGRHMRMKDMRDKRTNAN